MQVNASWGNSLWAFFPLVLILSVPLWVIGDRPLPLPVNLPLSALTAFVPMIAAAGLRYRQSGFTGVKELLQRAWDFKRIKHKIWLLPTLLLAPLIYLLSYVIMRLMALPLPDPQVPLLLAPVFFLLYFITGIGEELGWTGYAIDPMQDRWGALRASIILGAIWAIWHSIAFVQTHNPAIWIAWQCLKTIAFRIILVWLYNNTGKSVAAVILYHAIDNVCWSLFPNYGSHYDPFVTGIITWLAAAIVIFGWGPKTLARDRYSGANRSPNLYL